MSAKGSLCFLPFLAVLVITIAVPCLFTTKTLEMGSIKEVVFHSLTTLGFLCCAAGAKSGLAFLPSRAILLPIAGYLATSVLAYAISDYKYMSSTELWRRMQFISFFFLCHAALTTKKRIGLLLYAVMITGTGMCIYGLLQAVGIDPITWSGSSRIRIFSLVGNPNMFAGYLLVLIPLSFGFPVVVGVNWKTIMLGVGTGLLGITALLLTSSKGGFIGFGFGLIALAAIVLRTLNVGRAGDWRKKSLIVLGALILAAAPVLTWPLLKRGGTTIKASLGTRLVYWGGAMKMFEDSPLVGKGLGTFQVHFPRYRRSDWREKHVTNNTLHAHSEIMETAAESGLVGLFSLLCLMGTFWMVGWRNAVECSDTRLKCLSGALFIGLVAVFAHNSVSVNLRWFVVPVYLWLAMSVVAVTQSRFSTSRAAENRWGYDFGSKAGPLRLALVILVVGSLYLWCFIELTMKRFVSEVELRKGVTLLERTAWKSSLAYFDDSLEWNHKNLRGLYKKGFALFQLGRYGEAIEFYSKLRRLAPDFAALHENLAFNYVCVGDFDGAIAELEASERIQGLPRGFPYDELIRILRLPESPSFKKELYFNTVLRITPGDGPASVEAARLLIRDGRDAIAVKILERCIDVNPLYVGAYALLADFYVEEEKLDRALAVCARGLNVKPDAVALGARVAQIYADQGQSEKLNDALNKVRILDPKNEVLDLGNRKH